MVDYFLEADPTNTYVSTNVGNEMPLIWDETTQTGENLSVFYYDDGVSLTFVNAVTGVTINPYDESGFDTGYAYVFWDVAAADGSVTISVTLSTYPNGPDIVSYSATNTASEGGDATSAIVLLPTAVLIPPGGCLRVSFTHNGTPTTFTIGGEISLDYAEAANRKWWDGVVGWGPDAETGV